MIRLRIPRATAAILGVGALLLVMIAVIAIALVREQYSSALNESEGQATRFVSGAEAAINRNFLGLDVLLASTDKLLDISVQMQEWLDARGTSLLIQKAMRQNLLASRIGLIDESGTTLASSDYVDRLPEFPLPAGYLQQVLAPAVSTMVISAPSVSFRSSERVLYFGRYIKLADARRIIAVAEVPIPQLTAVLVQGVDIRGLETTIERITGELLVASPVPENFLGRSLNPPLETLAPWNHPREMRSRLGNEEAIVVVRNTLYSGVFITASIPLSDALEDGRQQAMLITWMATVLALLILASGALTLWYLNRLNQARLDMGRAKEVLDQALESMISGFLLLDAGQRVVNWNRRYLELHPWLATHIEVGMAFRELVEHKARHTMAGQNAEDVKEWVTQRMDHLAQGREAHQVQTRDGLTLEVSARPTPDGGTVILYQDVTRLSQAVADVELLAFYDPLTGLPNRRLLNDRLQQAINTGLRTGRNGALLFLDLDHFKTLNDTAGHLMGDMLLQQVAQRLKAAVRDEDTVARLGGDEFVVMLQSLSSELDEATEQARHVGASILSNLNQPYFLQGAEYTSSSSIGATLFGRDYQEATELLRQADIAMYQVKATGRNDLCFFDPKMLTDITVRADMERDLRHALAEEQFELHYQVQVGAQSHPTGAEVLIRWRHPQKGLVPPVDFIGLAEETGLIVPIGEWVLRTACQKLREWEHLPVASDLQLAVNVSARQFRNDDFVNQVQRILQETGARPERLELELTESLVLDNIRDAIDKMEALRRLGVRFSMDDFGTGYSSLSYLTRLPLNQLKIDQSFVRNIGQQASDSAVIDTIIGLARSLGLEVIAEGVETVDQRDFLEQHGCSMWQGYLFGRPMPVKEFEAWLIPSRIAF